MTSSSVRRNHLVKLLDEEVQNAAKIDTSFFKNMEMDLAGEH